VVSKHHPSDLSLSFNTTKLPTRWLNESPSYRSPSVTPLWRQIPFASSRCDRQITQWRHKRRISHRHTAFMSGIP
jgi:hypothetical protein